MIKSWRMRRAGHVTHTWEMIIPTWCPESKVYESVILPGMTYVKYGLSLWQKLLDWGCVRTGCQEVGIWERGSYGRLEKIAFWEAWMCRLGIKCFDHWYVTMLFMAVCSLEGMVCLLLIPTTITDFSLFLFGFSTTSISDSVYIEIQHRALNEFALILAVTPMCT